MLKKALLPAIMAVPLAGCVSLGADPPPSLLTLTPARTIPAGASTTGAASSALAVLEPSADQRLNVTRVPVQTSDSSLAYLKDAVWVEKPARLFQNLVAETIRSKGNRLVVREGDLGYDGMLQRPDGQVQTRRFESRVPAAAEAGAVGPALNEAANQVASEVAEWVG
jgi:cholesterol transport system auxiliary component